MNATIKKLTALSLLLLPVLGIADSIDDSFFPYANEVPTHEGLNPGMTVNSGNVSQFDNWQLVVGANFKTGGSDHKFDDCRLCNPFGPFTTSIPPLPEHGNGTVSGSAGLGGFEPLGRFRSGPLGMAEKEDEIQITLRYRF